MNEKCCLCICFTELYFFYWLFVVSLVILFAVPLVFSRLVRASYISRGREPRNSGKSAKSREIAKNTQNTAKFGRNLIKYTCLYSNFETCLSYRGYFLAVTSQINVKPSSLKRANNVLKLPGVDYVAKNWALAMMLKALPSVHFWNVLLKEQMMTSVRKTLKTLVWSAQNRSISLK